VAFMQPALRDRHGRPDQIGRAASCRNRGRLGCGGKQARPGFALTQQ